MRGKGEKKGYEEKARCELDATPALAMEPRGRGWSFYGSV